MGYDLKINPDKYTWSILKSGVSEGRYVQLLVETIGPAHVGEHERAIENRAKQALKRLQEPKPT